MPIYKPSSQQHRSGARSRRKVSPPSYESLTLSIDGLSDEGRGIGQYEGKKVFVDGALPTETVEATVLKTHRTYLEAKVKKVLQASPDRLIPPCQVFKQCGGCSVQYMPQQLQLMFKQDAVLSQLSRWAKIVPEQIVAPIYQSPYAYRQRVRLAVDYHKNGELFFGFREANSHRLVNVQQCHVVTAPLQALLAPLRQWLISLKPKTVSHIELIQVNTQAVAVLLRHVRPLSVEFRQSLSRLLEETRIAIPDLSSNVINIWFQGEKHGQLENVAGTRVDALLQYSLADEVAAEDEPAPLLSFHPQDFIQSNGAVNRLMVTQAIEWMAPTADEHIVDLFCGIGNFSLPLAKKAKFVTGIEGVQAMTDRAWDNARANNISNIKFEALDLSAEGLESNTSVFDGSVQVDGVLLDPPRTGAKAICEQIMKLAPHRIVYVSCDSSTFARDAKLLSGHGFRLSRLGVVDMFPQTPHIEVMGLFLAN